MRVLFTLFLMVFTLGIEYAINQAYTDYLKAHVTWEVTDYEENIFRAWTVDELKELLMPVEMLDMEIPSVPYLITDDSELKETDWSKDAGSCIHEVRNQASPTPCAAGWAFAVAGLVSDRCCMKGNDHGWLSPQQLISCDIFNRGCEGSVTFAVDYVVRNGLVHEACFPYVAKSGACPYKCKDGEYWFASHVCKCWTKVPCHGITAMAKCLESGPIAATFYVYPDFLYYKSGIYHWNKQGKSVGRHVVRCHGYGTFPEKHWKCINSWGTDWGMKGYFNIAIGECEIDTQWSGYCDPV